MLSQHPALHCNFGLTYSTDAKAAANGRQTVPDIGELRDLIVSRERAVELSAMSESLPSWDLNSRQLCDLELLLNGAFYPLDGFLQRQDYQNVCSAMRLWNGSLWPIPITLDVTERAADILSRRRLLALRDPEGVLLAVLHITDVWRPDKRNEAQYIYGTDDQRHAGVSQLLADRNPIYVGGRVEGLQLPIHYDFQHLRYTPAALRALFIKFGWKRIVGFQTCNPMHRAHVELTMRAIRTLDACLLIHPSVGITEAGDIDHYTRVRCYQEVLQYYPPNTAHLALLPLAMRMAGPREAMWHAIIRKNYGCTHFIVGRNHTGSRATSNGKRFYGPYDGQKLFQKYAVELGIDLVPFEEMVYVQEMNSFVPESEVPNAAHVIHISGTDLRRSLQEGLEVPEWFTFPSVVERLKRKYPPRLQQGFTIFFTGLSGAGKSTIANVLLIKLLEMGGRPITLLDGDIVRKNLSSELGFSREDRDINIRRIGFVAKEITKNGGIAICAPIAPYDTVRKDIRRLVESHGGFVLVHVATPLEICEQRDRKGLYAKARAGLIRYFTGISDPYEIPDDANVVINTAEMTAEESAQLIILHLEREGFINGPSA
jgi:sulfate adenylyltransferase